MISRNYRKEKDMVDDWTDKENGMPVFFSPMRDYVFRYLFGNAARLDVTADLIYSVTGVRGRVELMDPIVQSGMESGKTVIPDILLNMWSVDGVPLRIMIVSIDVQRWRHVNFDYRYIIYPSSLLVNQFFRGDQFGSAVPVTTIVFVEFDQYPDNPIYVHKWCWTMEDGRVNPLVQTIVVEVSKAPLLFDGTLLWRWVNFLRLRGFTLSAEERSHVMVNTAYDDLVHLSMDPVAAHMLVVNRLDKMDMNAIKAEGRAEGRVEGEAKGRFEGKAEGEKKKAMEVARMMKEEHMSLPIIAKMTSLSIDDIKKL
jgi:predicted transposase/invertase (TIGR01784 family)